MLTLRHLRYFLTISEEKSFVSAAKKLDTVQSSLSQQIKDLENYLDVELFERGSRVFTLTQAGEVFLEEAKKTLVEAEKAKNFAYKLNSKNSVVKIGVLIGVEVKIPKVILDLIKFHDTSVKIELVSEMGPALIKKLEKGEIDLAFTRSYINNSEISSIECLEEDLLLAMHKSHPLAQAECITLKELSGSDIILPSIHHAPELRQQTLDLMKKNNINFNIIMESENAFVTMSYISMGMGVSILPDFVRGMVSGNTVVRRFSNIQPKIKLFINYKNMPNTPSLDRLIENFKKII